MTSTRSWEYTERIAALLSESKVCRSLTTGARSLLAESAVSKRLSRGEALWRRGDPGRFCTLIRSGSVEILRPTAPPAPGTRTKIFGTDDVIGLSTLFRNAPFEDDAVAIQDGTETVSFFLRPLLEDVDDIRSVELGSWVRRIFRV